MKFSFETGRPISNWFVHYQLHKDLGERISWYLGFAWTLHNIRVDVFMPVPLNYIASWARDIWWLVRRGRADERDKIYNAGIEIGREQGRRIGHAEGYTEAKQEVLSIVDRLRNR